MAVELKQNLKLSQQLVITPQLQQAIKLLQLSRVELADVIQNELTENPVLEEAPQVEEEDVPADMAQEIERDPLPDKSHETQSEVVSQDGDLKEPKDFDWENYIDNYNDAGAGLGSINRDELPTYENITSSATTLDEHLEWQLRMSNYLPEEEAIGIQIIGYLDDNGYLTITPEEIAEKHGFDEEQVKDILYCIQEYDPAGVGARNLQECLIIQSRQFGPVKHLLKEIISNHLSLLEKRDYRTIAKKMKITLEEVIDLAKIIGEMEPKPGRSFGRSDTQYITPDVYVHKVGSEYTVVLNDEGLPRLKVSSFYRNMMTQNSFNGGDAKDYVQDKLKSALWLIRSIHQRQRTLYRVSKCIVEFQKDFLDQGINHLKPMILRDVAEEIGVHESTVSRATSNKYIHTPQGIYELKFFFNSGVSVMMGHDVASETVKERIRTMISQEDAKKPLSDQEIANKLKEDNIDIARRTVAKYREMLHILPSSKRKQLY